MATDWWKHWHGAPIPSTWVDGLPTGGGSTNLSTGVLLALSTKASDTHGHVLGDVTGLTSTLAGLASQVSTKAAGVHSHVTGDVTGLDSTLAGLAAQVSTKAAGTHSHAQSDVTGLVGALSSKADATVITTALSTKASLNSGLVPTAQLGSSAASASVFLRGDQVWSAPVAAPSGVPSTWVTLSTHVLTGSTTMQSVTGLNFTISSAATYRFEFTMGWQTISSATGIAFGVNGPASPLLIVYEAGASTGLGPTVTRAGRAFGVQTVATPGSSAANLNEYGYVTGLVRNGATAGTLQAQFASEVAGSTVSIRAGSLGMLWGPL